MKTLIKSVFGLVLFPRNAMGQEVIGKQMVIKKYSGVALLFVFAINAFCQQTHSNFRENSYASNADSVLSWLKKGNQEFIHGKFNLHGVDSSLRLAISTEQHPKAVILTCSDSRVPPELIFDKGLGDLFVIRVAGNISDDAVIGSIEYAVEHLHTTLVVVMGHSGCGAVTAAVAHLKNPENKIENHIHTLTDKIEEAIATEKLHEKDPMQNALLSNIIFTVSSLKESRPDLHEAVKKGEIKIVGALYDLKTGNIKWLENKNGIQ
ncbi:MAG: carbonic anhydrase [Flavisolibacter sp.]|jgi:carbonic anhydrase